ncbi:MAG: PaaI family thioesterase [Gordonia sp. (in: high G+C Gram-positive bacteria)]
MQQITFEELTERSGLEFVREVFGLDVRPPIISDVLGMRLVDATEGEVVFAVDADAALGNLAGTVHGGLLATLLDSAMACAVHTTLPARTDYGTVDLHVTFVRAAPTDGRPLRAVGTVVHSGRTLVTAEAKVVDADGRLLAHATSSCLIRRGR